VGGIPPAGDPVGGIPPAGEPRRAIPSEAKALHINISHAAEAGLAQAIARRHTELWLEEHEEAINSSNAFVEEHGLPLAKYRMF
jgi:antitoxin CcdA